MQQGQPFTVYDKVAHFVDEDDERPVEPTCALARIKQSESKPNEQRRNYSAVEDVLLFMFLWWLTPECDNSRPGVKYRTEVQLYVKRPESRAARIAVVMHSPQ